jgi:nitroreductase
VKAKALEESMFKDLVSTTRSIRRYDESFKVNEATLREIVDLARLSPSSANLQALKFKLVTEPSQVNAVFESIRFAAYLKDWSGPQPGERPTAYIIIVGDLNIKRQFDVDAGIAAQSMLLGLTELGLGGCMMGSFKRDQLTELFDLEPTIEIVLVLAIGKPAEKVVIEPMKRGDDVKYYRDEEGVHHVPKRSLDELII